MHSRVRLLIQDLGGKISWFDSWEHKRNGVAKQQESSVFHKALCYVQIAYKGKPLYLLGNYSPVVSLGGMCLALSPKKKKKRKRIEKVIFFRK